MTQISEISPSLIAGMGAAMENAEAGASFDSSPRVQSQFSAIQSADHAFDTMLDALLIRGGCALSSEARSHILRRIRQRMKVRNIDRIDAYCILLERDADEDYLLFNGLLNGKVMNVNANIIEPTADEWQLLDSESSAVQAMPLL